ncbi:MAG: NAD(P)/FAD-dependent oxidoreductase [Gemmatimonadota bacterium]
MTDRLLAHPRVVVVGAGFGGLWCARTLANEPVDVTLLDRRNYHTFFPLLYQVAAAELVPTDIAYPVRSIFRKARNVEVRMAEVTEIDLENREVRTHDGALPYDVLVLAPGSEPNFFGVEGADRHAFPLRWMDDAIPLRHHVLSRFEAAATRRGDARRRALTFVVVGGGPTGVEFAGALSELLHGPLLRDFPTIDRAEVRIELVEAGPGVLAGMPSELAEYALERLKRRNVAVRLGTAVEGVGATEVLLAGGGRLETETVVWTAGVQGDPRVASWGLPVGRGGRVPVTDALTVEGRPEVYVIGDLALVEEQGTPLPQVAQVAIQQGRHAAGNILRAARGEAPVSFRYKDLGMLAVIGRSAAVAHVFGRAFRGFTAWVLWLGIHIAWLIGFRNRALVLVNWAWNYVSFRRAVRLILPTVTVERPRGDGSDEKEVP